MSNRFVILHHRQDPGEHWDLMLEQGDVLLTWQLLRNPTVLVNYPIPARRTGDHRKAYLDYEGPLTRNRGTVRRVDCGTVEVEENAPKCVRFKLNGGRLWGSFLLRPQAEGWSFETAGG
ncbi:MAG: DNA polymerase ligase N-terminal domain-containing protein [Planctomycetota bacterium]